MRHVAFADRSDVIRFDAPDEIISAAAWPAHDNETLLVSDAPEAKSDDAALAAVVTFAKAVDARVAERVMTPPDLMRRLAARKLAAARLATDLILDCERAASGRNGKRADPARWTETDWRSYLRAAARSPAASRLAPLYHAIGDIEAALRVR